MNMWDDIVRFHDTFGIPQAEIPDVMHDPEIMVFRLKFLHEELHEFETAVAEGNRVDAFDALLDLVYVAMGTAYICNFPWEDGWEHVQEANMLKRRVETSDESKRRSKYDVVKPDGWVAPNQALHAHLLFKEFEIRMAKFKEQRDENISRDLSVSE